MTKDTLEHLRITTKEEQRLLADGGMIDKEIYTTSKEFTVDSNKMMEKGRLIDIRSHTRFITFPAHKHNYIEIMYMCEGKTEHIINGNTRVIVEKGDLLFMNQFASHEIAAALENDIGINFIILPEFFDAVLPMLNQGNALSNFIISTLRKDTNVGGYLHYKVADVLPVQNLVENLIWSLLNRQVNYQEVNQTTMGLLFMQLVNETDRIEAGNPELSRDIFVMQILKYIEENYKKGTLADLAEQMSQSTSNMSKLIKNYTGRNFKDLLQKKRLKQAEYLIGNTYLSITEIIYQVGYDNTSYFHRIFRQAYGMSPKNYRVKNRSI